MPGHLWRWIYKSRRRSLTFLGIFSGAVFLLCWFWGDLCLWRADANLVLRRNSAAERWITLSRWGRTNPSQVCLLELRVARRMGRFYDVETLLRQASQKGVRVAELHREQLLAMAQAQQFEQVAPYWGELLSDPRDDEPEIARAFVIWASSHDLIRDAFHVLDLWEKDYPKDPEPFALHGRLAVAMNQDEVAVTSYRKALEIAPGNDDYRLALADALQKQLKFDEASNLYQECIRRTPNNVAALKGLSETYTSLGEVDKAISILRDAIKIAPGNLELERVLGESYLAKGDDTEALPYLQRIHAAHPENADFAYRLAQALKSLKRDSEAASLFEFVAESREPLGQLKTLQERLDKHPEDLNIRMQIATISAKYKSREEAIRWLEKLLLISPKYQPAHKLLVELYQLTGQPEKSARHRTFAESTSKPFE